MTTWLSGLPARLFAAIVVVATFAVAATAYFAVRTTRNVIEEERERAVASNEQIYSALVTYGATHRDWAGVGSLMSGLARNSGLRITLVAAGVRLDTASARKPPTHAATIVDPLQVDPALDQNADGQGIDRAAVGPFTVSATARATLAAQASEAAACFSKLGIAASVVQSPSGRPYFRTPADAHRALIRCVPSGFTDLESSEVLAVSRLEASMINCLPSSGRSSFRLVYDVSEQAAPVLVVVSRVGRRSVDGTVPSPAGDCLALARHRQLEPYVAPPAQLYLSEEDGTQVNITSVAHVSPFRVTLTAGAVLALAALVAAAGAIWLGRSLRPVTHAAQRMRHGDTSARVPVRARAQRARGRKLDDLSELAVAFNDMAAAVQDGERAQKNLIADVSHELRSPLTVICGWVEALQDGVVEPDAATLDIIAGQARQLEHVLDDLRDLALAEAGQLNLTLVPIGLEDLVVAVCTGLAVWAHQAGVTLVEEVEALSVEVDPARLTQCLSNLVSNAITYSRPGGVVRIESRRERGAVVIDVIDDGIGISHEDLPHIFDRLWRAEHSRDRRAGGSGLGLPIARRIAIAHGGDLTVSSVVGSGSTFSITLPTRGPGRSGLSSGPAPGDI